MSKALVTGGTRGIGKAIAEALRGAGHEVVVIGKQQNAEHPVGCSYLSCDFIDPLQVDLLANRVSNMGFDILINNAGINKIGMLVEYSLEDYDRIQQVNVRAAYRLCQAVAPGMMRRKLGWIVNITSVWGVVSKMGRSAYSASKFAMQGFSRALALELAPYNVLVNCVAPGFVDTDLTRQTLGEDGIAQMVKQIPIGRLVQPTEIAVCVKFLVSADNTYLTGQTIVIDGGFTSA